MTTVYQSTISDDACTDSSPSWLGKVAKQKPLPKNNYSDGREHEDAGTLLVSVSSCGGSGWVVMSVRVPNHETCLITDVTDIHRYTAQLLRVRHPRGAHHDSRHRRLFSAPSFAQLYYYSTRNPENKQADEIMTQRPNTARL